MRSFLFILIAAFALSVTLPLTAEAGGSRKPTAGASAKVGAKKGGKKGKKGGKKGKKGEKGKRSAAPKK